MGAYDDLDDDQLLDLIEAKLLELNAIGSLSGDRLTQYLKMLDEARVLTETLNKLVNGPSPSNQLH